MTVETKDTQELRETIRQMLKDWDAATDDQRTSSLRIAAEKAARAHAKILRELAR